MGLLSIVHKTMHMKLCAKVKDKENILKAAREKNLVTYRGAPIRLSIDY